MEIKLAQIVISHILFFSKETYKSSTTEKETASSITVVVFSKKNKNKITVVAYT